MNAAELDRLARAYLLDVRTPGDPEVAELVDARGAAGAAGMVTSPTGSSWQEYAESVAAVARTGDLRLVIPGDLDWPAFDLDLLGIWVTGAGRLGELAARAVGIAGAARATPYGVQITARIAWELAQAGWTVVTLGRPGIDSAAVRGVLRRNWLQPYLDARRVGIVTPPPAEVLVGSVSPPVVLPLGHLMEPAPSAHASLFRRVGWDGLLAGEHGTRMPHRPLAADHDRQGQLMAGLVRALVLVEPGWGSRWLVDAAEAAGLPVLAVPGPVGSELSEGAHELIRAGRARLITGTRDVLAALAGDR